MESYKNIQSQEILKSIIFNTYLSFFQKFKDTNVAYTHTAFALETLLREDKYDAFTRTNNIRKVITSTFANPEDCKTIILDTFVDMILQNPPPKTHKEVNLYNTIVITNNSHGKTQVLQSLKEVLKNNNYDSFSRFHKDNQQFNYREILKNSVSSQDIAKIIASTFTSQTLEEIAKSTENSSNKISKQYENEISNFHINPYTVNQCKLDLLSSEQQSVRHHDYSLGDLYVSIDLGNEKENQEDSAIILTHPQNPNFKILVVADGMGGLMAGEKASSFITTQIMNWFEHLDPQYFVAQNIDSLTQRFNEEIQNISNNLYNTYRGNASSTFVGAIVSEENTVISHVGDSRAYIYTKGELHQLTKDDSVCYRLWQGGMIQQKDDIRFHKDSNKVLKGMGFTENVTPTTSILSNSDYDTLLLFSDGVTDCLSDDQIKAITSKTDIRELAKILVNTAKINHSHQNHLPLDTYNSNILGGKDNITAAVYDNHSKNSKDEGR